MNGVAVGVNGRVADRAVVVCHVMKFDKGLGSATHGFFEGEISVAYFESNVADTIPVLLDVLGRRVVAMQWRAQDEVRLILLEDVGGLLAISGFKSTVGELRKSERLAVIER